MVDIANLEIRISSLEVLNADERLRGLESAGAGAEKATAGLVATFKKIIGPLAIATGAFKGLKEVVNVTREFNILNAQLVTATGSSEDAAIAFQAIQDFATKTPFSLAEATESFVKLTNLGLDPSEKALTAYGNTASAMGKDLNQLIDAIGNAATGEFDSLKQFGIKAKAEGDNISFIFRGVTTTVGNSTEEIEGYLQSLGENEFAGAMQQRVDTLDGAISNLGDEWNKLFLGISNLGLGELIEDGVRIAIDVLEELNAIVASGQFEASLEAIGDKFDGLGGDIASSLDIIVGFWNDFLGTPEGGGIAGATSETIDFLIAAFKNIPENIRTVIQLAAVEISALVDFGLAFGRAFGEVLGTEFAKIVEKSKAYGKAIGQAVNPFDNDEFDLESELRRLDSVAEDLANGAFERAQKQIDITRQARRDSIQGIFDEREAALSSFDTQIKAADNLRKKFDEQTEARSKSGQDVLGQFKVGVSDEGESSSARKKREKEEEERGKALENLRLSLRTEEEEIQESFDNRLSIILANTEEGTVQQEELKQRLKEEFSEQAIGDLNIADTNEEEIAQLNDFYQRRKELILANTALTEEERTLLELQLTEQRNQQLEQLELERAQTILTNSEALFGSLTDLAKQFGGEQSGAFKALFAVTKAFSLAQAIVQIQAGIAGAAALPFPANLPAIGSVVAATSSIVSTIAGAQFSGAMDAGGIIPQGKVGLVGEFGPEIVQGPANVRSRRDTAELFKQGKSEGGEQAAAPPPQLNVKNINVLDPTVVGDFLGTDAGEQMIMNVVQRNQRAIGF